MSIQSYTNPQWKLLAEGLGYLIIGINEGIIFNGAAPFGGINALGNAR